MGKCGSIFKKFFGGCIFKIIRIVIGVLLIVFGVMINTATAGCQDGLGDLLEARCYGKDACNFLPILIVEGIINIVAGALIIVSVFCKCFKWIAIGGYLACAIISIVFLAMYLRFYSTGFGDVNPFDDVVVAAMAALCGHWVDWELKTYFPDVCNLAYVVAIIHIVGLVFCILGVVAMKCL